eukprot:GHVN01069316.1.p1 GENE.GHVN01069316.1~~GHVN01069316.1.p1  ORF type:complete len:288 (-),score=32.19 GHVN01069316.1:1962-2825(-)
MQGIFDREAPCSAGDAQLRGANSSSNPVTRLVDSLSNGAARRQAAEGYKLADGLEVTDFSDFWAGGGEVDVKASASSGPNAHWRPSPPALGPVRPQHSNWAAEFAAFTTVQGGQPRTGEQADADQHLWAKEFAVPSTQPAFPATSGPMLRSLRPLNPSLYRTPANQHTAPTHESYEDTVQPPELGIEAAKRLEDVLKDVGKSNGKLRESEFTKFVSHLANGDIEVSGNNLTDSKGNPVDWDELYAAEHKGDDRSQNHETEVISSPDFERRKKCQRMTLIVWREISVT